MVEEAYNFRPLNIAKLKPGVSGLMRVKNDGEFVEACIESCITALDELIIVFNDCSDNSELIIRKCAAKYPEKIRVFEYKASILANNLTEAEYKEALLLPSDSPRLLCNYYNFALAKARFTHAVKIDADQIYFSDQLRYWCDIARGKKIQKRNVDCFIGRVLFNIFRILRKLSIATGRRSYFLGIRWSRRLLKAYRHYAEVGFSEGSLTISLSGLNVYRPFAGGWFVPLGLKCEPMNILPPFNGENDHLIFKISDKTYYRPLVSDYYNLQRSSGFSLIEEMEHPYTPINVGFCWYHLNACRKSYSEKAEASYGCHHGSYMPIQEFLSSSFSEIESRSDKTMFTLYQRILFSFLFENLRFDLCNEKLIFEPKYD